MVPRSVKVIFHIGNDINDTDNDDDNDKKN